MFKGLLILTTIGLTAFAGPGNTGGGKGVVCKNAEGKIESVELLDLYEARTTSAFAWEFKEKFEKLKAKLANYSVREIIKESSEILEDRGFMNSYSKSFQSDGWHYGESLKALKKRGNVTFSQQYVLSVFDMFATNVDFINETGKERWANVRVLIDNKLSPTEDSFEISWPANCSIEQIAVQENYSDYYINYNLYKLMDKYNQAALWLHEGIYKYLRHHSLEKNSIRTRALVGRIFLDQLESTFSAKENLYGKKAIECETPTDYVSNSMDKYFTFPGVSKVYLVEIEDHVFFVPTQLNGIFTISVGTSVSLVATLKNIQKTRGFGGGSVDFPLGKFDDVLLYVGKDKPTGKLQVKVNAKNFTNGAAGFSETLECSDKIKTIVKDEIL